MKDKYLKMEFLLNNNKNRNGITYDRDSFLNELDLSLANYDNKLPIILNSKDYYVNEKVKDGGIVGHITSFVYKPTNGLLTLRCKFKDERLSSFGLQEHHLDSYFLFPIGVCHMKDMVVMKIKICGFSLEIY